MCMLSYQCINSISCTHELFVQSHDAWTRLEPGESIGNDRPSVLTPLHSFFTPHIFHKSLFLFRGSSFLLPHLCLHWNWTLALKGWYPDVYKHSKQIDLQHHEQVMQPLPERSRFVPCLRLLVQDQFTLQICQMNAPGIWCHKAQRYLIPVDRAFWT